MSIKPIIFSAPMVKALLAGTKTQTRRLLNPQPPEWATFCQQPDMLNVNHQWVPSGLWRWSEPEKSTPEPLRQWPLDTSGQHYWLRPPYAPHDRVYVREAYYQFGHWEPVEGKQTKGGRQKWAFVGDHPLIVFNAPEEHRLGRHHKDPSTPAWHKRLGRFMPRAESRMWLEITDVRVQRLQDISEEDAKAEGIVWQEPTEEDRQWAVDQAVEYGCSADIEGVWTVHGAGGPGKADIWGVTPQQSYQFLWNTLHTEPGTRWADNPWIVAYTFTVHQGNVDAA